MSTWRVPTRDELQMARDAGYDTRHLMANRDVTEMVMLLDLKTRQEIFLHPEKTQNPKRMGK